MSELKTVRALAPTEYQYGDGTPVLEPGEYAKADVARDLYDALNTLYVVIGLTALKHAHQLPALQEACDKASAALAAARGESHA